MCRTQLARLLFLLICWWLFKQLLKCSQLLEESLIWSELWPVQFPASECFIETEAEFAHHISYDETSRARDAIVTVDKDTVLLVFIQCLLDEQVTLCEVG